MPTKVVKTYSEDLQYNLDKLRKKESNNVDDANLVNFQARLRRRNQLDVLELELARERGEVCMFCYLDVLMFSGIIFTYPFFAL